MIDIYTSGAAGQNVLWAFAGFFGALSLMSLPPMLFPTLSRWKKTCLVASLVIGGVVGVLFGAAAAGDPIPLLGTPLFSTPLFETEPESIGNLLLPALLSFGAGCTLLGLCLSRMHRERVRMETELKLARGIQERLLPVVNAEADRYSAYGAARLASEVGGDFFDVMEPDENGGPLVVAVGDVAGHNVAAGLMMATAKGAFRGALGAGQPAATAPTGLDLGSGSRAEFSSTDAAAERVRGVLETMNRTVYAHAGRRHFVSAQVGRFDFAAGRLALGNAGHVPLFCWRHDTGAVETLAPRSAALGVLPDGAAGIDTVPAVPGDVFLFYTDGLLEARSPDGTEFGLERARDLLAAEAPNASPQALCERFFEVLDAHTGGNAPGDDVTLLAVRIG